MRGHNVFTVVTRSNFKSGELKRLMSVLSYLSQYSVVIQAAISKGTVLWRMWQCVETLRDMFMD